jgi:iron-sulfur cluster insertion protein
MIYLTEKAAKQVREVSDAEGIGYYIIRVKVRGGSCAGFEYDLAFDDQINDLDEVFEIDGVKLVCDPISIQYMEGTSIDYDDGLMGTGFRFQNPTSTGSCGCGKSFSV